MSNLKNWISSWQCSQPPNLPGIILFATSERLERILFIGACPGSMSEQKKNFECEFGSVLKLLSTMTPDYITAWWAVPTGELSLIGQLPSLINKLTEEFNPVLKQFSPVQIKSSEPEINSIVDIV